MNITISPAAMRTFTNDWGFTDGDFVRIYVRYGGHSTVHEGYSLGIAKEAPKAIGVSTTLEGVTYYVEQDDLWYLNGKDLTIDYRQDTEEIVFQLR